MKKIFITLALAMGVYSAQAWNKYLFHSVTPYYFVLKI